MQQQKGSTNLNFSHISMHVRMVEMERILGFGPITVNTIPMTLPSWSITGPPVPHCIQ
jgi:hypothetical protein